MTASILAEKIGQLLSANDPAEVFQSVTWHPGTPRKSARVDINVRDEGEFVVTISKVT